MKRRVVVSLALCVTFLVTGHATAHATSGWVIVTGVNPGGNNNLSGVAAVSTSDVWAVGSTNAPGSGILIEHWDGTTWSQVSPSVPPGFIGSLAAISAVSASDIWAVGSSGSGANMKSLTMHWDGTQWSVIHSPNVGQTGTGLIAVTALSSHGVWAVGNSGEHNPTPVAMHWDGTQWSLYLPAVPPNVRAIYVRGVAAAGSHHVWLVGGYINNAGYVILTEQWNGTAWTIVPAPFCCEFTAITHFFGPRMIAIGWGSMPPGLAEEWNGSTWYLGYSLPPDNSLFAITAGATAGVWSVGSVVESSASQTLTLHGDVVVPSPNTPLPFNELDAVSVTPGTGEVWAVGRAFGNSNVNVLIEQYTP